MLDKTLWKWMQEGASHFQGATLVVPWTISVFGIFLMRPFFVTVPDDLIDAARMDGCPN